MERVTLLDYANGYLTNAVALLFKAKQTNKLESSESIDVPSHLSCRAAIVRAAAVVIFTLPSSSFHTGIIIQNFKSLVN